jgi:hypothetical protein
MDEEAQSPHDVKLLVFSSLQRDILILRTVSEDFLDDIVATDWFKEFIRANFVQNTE